MDSTIETLEIVIKARIDDALKNIKTITDEVKKRVSSSATSMSELTQKTREISKNLEPVVSKTKNSMKQYEQTVKQATTKVTDELSKVKNSKIDIDVSKIDVDNLGYDELKQKYNELQSVRDELAKKFTFEVLDEDEIKKLDEVVLKLFEVRNALEEQESMGLSTPDGTANPYSSKAPLNDYYIKPVIDFDESQAANETQKVTSTINDKFKNINLSSLKRTINDVKNELNEINNNPVISKLKSAFSSVTGIVKKFIPHIKNAKKESSNFGNSLGTSLSKGLKSLKRFTLSLLSIRTAFSAISRASQAYLSFDTQLQESIQNSWNALGSLLAPILEYVASLFSKITSTIASFVKALTGVDLIARANAKALDKQAKSTANANKQLSSIDDISNLSSNNSSENSQTITVEDVDITPLENFAKKVADIFSKIFEPFQKAWETKGQDVINSMKKAFENTKSMVKDIGQSFMEVWTNGTGETYLTGILKIIEQIFNIIGGLAGAFDEAWNAGSAGTGLIQSIGDAAIALNNGFSAILNSFQEVINNGTITETFGLLIEIGTQFWDIISGIANAFTHAWENAGTGTAIIQHISDIFNDVLKFVSDIGDSIKNWVISPEFQEALDKVFGGIEDIFNYIKEVCDWLLEMYEKYVKPVVDEKLLPAISSIVTAIMDVWNAAIKPVVDFFVEYYKAVLEPYIQGLMNFIGGIIDVIKGIADFISGVFTGDWEKAWNGIKEIFGGIIDAIAALIKKPLNILIAAFEFVANKVIGAFNWVKSMLNNLSFDVPDWVPFIGGQKWGFNLEMTPELSIPRLKTGNVAEEPMVGIFGEYANAKSNPEITAPQSILKSTFRDALEEYSFNNSKSQHITVQFGSKDIIDEIIDEINKRITRRGATVWVE